MPTPTPMQLQVRALFERIAANFNDADAWRTYGDTLVQKADPRGELIAAWHLRREEFADVVAKHRDALFGDAAADLAPESPIEIGWHMGTVASVKLTVTGAAGVPPQPRKRNRTRDALFDRLRALLERPVCQFLHTYTVEFVGCDGAVRDLLRPLPNGDRLRTLAISAVTSALERFGRPLVNDDDSFLSSVPNLERLSLEGRLSGTRFTMKPLSHAKLRTLELTGDNLFDPDFDALAASTLPALERLSLTFVGKGSNAQPETLRRWASSTKLPALRHLEIQHASYMADSVLAALTDSPLLGRLVTLDLTGSDFDAARLAHPSFATVQIIR